MHARPGDTVKWLKSVMRGYFQYHAVPRNEDRMKAFRHEVLRILWWHLRQAESTNPRGHGTNFWSNPVTFLTEVEALRPYPMCALRQINPNFRWLYLR